MTNFNILGTNGFRNQAATLFLSLSLFLLGISAAQAATVSGRVWLDGNKNGLQDNNESGMTGVFYFLIEVDANNVETEYFIGITGATGAYTIDIPNTGNFRVRIANPTNATNTYTFTLQDVNGNGSDDIDSDFDFFEGKTAVFAVTSMSQTFDFDAGFKLISTNEEEPESGCTLTQGYWKTHSKYGPAPYDPTWGLQGEDTPFFLSGKTWYEVMWTPPSGGNAYYSLAHQYIAAQLNFLNGASSTPEVTDAINAATTLFNTYTPAQWSSLPKSVKNQFKSLANILDQYNNGIIGPGHCDDEDDDDEDDDDDDDYGGKSKDRSAAADEAAAGTVTVTPNPTRDLVRIELPATFTLATDLHLMNGMGQVVLHERVPAGEYRTELQLTGADMPSGVYYLRVQSGDIIQTQKLVLVK